jgi:hypothetical protein
VSESGSISVRVMSGSSVWVEASTNCLCKPYAHLSTINENAVSLPYLSGVITTRGLTRTKGDDFVEAEDSVRQEGLGIGW